MKERREVFCIKAEGKNYCNCKLIFASSSPLSAEKYSEALFCSLLKFCDSIYEKSKDIDEAARKEFRITPYAFSASVKSVPLSDRISATEIICSFSSRFPHGINKKQIYGFLFDCKSERPISPASISMLKLFHKEKRIKQVESIFFKGDNLIFTVREKEMRFPFAKFEEKYFKMNERRKRTKAIDIFKEM